ncbi:hypothetical protein FOCC_FOCC016067 [Frankliniella occidentalis]|nr:hypothetical protein FOCC_FOCC016067 [Frankliniella occidentalis]
MCLKLNIQLITFDVLFYGSQYICSILQYKLEYVSTWLEHTTIDLSIFLVKKTIITFKIFLPAPVETAIVVKHFCVSAMYALNSPITNYFIEIFMYSYLYKKVKFVSVQTDKILMAILVSVLLSSETAISNTTVMKFSQIFKYFFFVNSFLFFAMVVIINFSLTWRGKKQVQNQTSKIKEVLTSFVINTFVFALCQIPCGTSGFVLCKYFIALRKCFVHIADIWLCNCL